MLPHESELTIHNNQLSVKLLIPTDLFWFRGHFDRQVILPGVAQLDWVMHYAKKYLVPTKQFVGIEQLKFTSPVPPEETLKLNITWQEDTQRLVFYYERQVGQTWQTISQGKVRLC